MRLITILRRALVLLALCLTAARAEPPPVAIGFYLPVLRDVARQDIEVSLRFWVEELARSLNLTYKPIQFYDVMEHMKHDMEAGRINFIVADAMGIARYFKPEDLRDGFSGYKQDPENLLLIARVDSGVHGPGDMVGKRVGVLDGDELSEVYLDTLLYKAWGRSGWDRLGEVVRETRSNRLAHQLFFGRIDAALIYRSAYEAAVALNPQVGARLKVLDQYTFKIRSPHTAMFSSAVNPEDREIITRAALRLNESARGRQVMQIYKADDMVRTQVRDLQPFYDLLAMRRALKASTEAKGRKGAR
jgi:hypothetical protein